MPNEQQIRLFEFEAFIERFVSPSPPTPNEIIRSQEFKINQNDFSQLSTLLSLIEGALKGGEKAIQENSTAKQAITELHRLHDAFSRLSNNVLDPSHSLFISPTQTPEDSEIIKILNQHSTEIAEKLQYEIRRVLPRYTVQADIFFSEGSIIAVGSIVLSFLAPLVVEAAKKSIEPALTQLMQFAIKRTLQRLIPGLVPGTQLSKVEVQVSPSSLDDGEQTIISKENPTNTSSNQLISPQYLMPLTIANTLLLFTLLVLLVIVVIRFP